MHVTVFATREDSGVRLRSHTAFDPAEVARRYAFRDFDIWFRSAEGRRTMVTAATTVDHVLRAQRVWLTLNNASRPKVARPAPGNGARGQPFRPKYDTLSRPDDSGSTVKWMSSSLD